MNSSARPHVSIQQRQACSACGCPSLEQVLELPDLPLTGIFIKAEDRPKFPSIDQALMRCTRCGHGQLRDTVDPVYLYQETYTHRSSLSPISTRGNDFFLGFLNELTQGQRFRSVAEIGCNDLYLLKRLEDRADHLVGFDPIWKGRTDLPAGKTVVKGSYIEEIRPADDIPERPDLVLSVHTLEHVNDPLSSLRPIYEHAREGALFVIEVPGFDTLLNISRFDQVFHQHLNYFSVGSFRRMIEQLGGEYVTHRFNYSYWLGTMLVAFRKPSGSVGRVPAPVNAPTRVEIDVQFKVFKQQLEGLKGSLARMRGQGVPLLGFGAAQMLPILAYHLGTDFSEFEGVLDDNPDKTGLTYPSLQTRILAAANYPTLDKHAVLLTAADSARPILSRVVGLKARYILFPFNPF
jgi:SAM-dependent methyltransferase